MHKIDIFLKCIGILVCCFSGGFSQARLTADEAVKIALEKNMLVRTLKNKAEIASINNSPGNAGMLPRIWASATASESNSDIDQKNAAGVTTSYKGENTTTLTPSVNATWTVFDGLRMFATKARLSNLSAMGELSYKDTLQMVAAATIVAYYDIVGSMQKRMSILSSLSLGQERVNITEKQFAVGTISKLDLLQARLDLNEQKSALLAIDNEIAQKKAALNLLLCRDAATDFTTEDSIPFLSDTATLSSVDPTSLSYQFLLADKAVAVAQSAKNEAVSYLLPSLSINGGYGYSSTENSAGSLLQNQSRGFSAGAALSVPLFSGFTALNQTHIAEINLKNAIVARENVRLALDSRDYLGRREFAKAKEALAFEEDNMKIAEEAITIARERFRLGQSNSLEMHTAQLSYITAVGRLISARTERKLAETELLRLRGVLVSQIGN